MAIKVDQQCTRCHRNETVAIDDIQEAVKLDEAKKRKSAGAEQLLKLCSELVKSGAMPDVFVAGPDGKFIAHTHLCDSEEAKRSCVKRVNDLMESINTLDERKPRTRKGKTNGAAEEAHEDAA